MASTDKDFIVAIELGSSKISGIAGRKKDGTMQILAYAEEKTTACVKRGIVYNIEKTYQCINNIIAKLETSLKTKINRAYIGIGGQSVRSYKCQVKRNLFTQSYITNEIIDSIHDESYDIPFSECEVLANIPQEFVVDQNAVSDPVGVMGTNVVGEYLNVIARKTLCTNVRTCFANTNVDIVDDMMLSPYQLANFVLTDAEKRSGCALVDLGAGTTTVSIYKNNILRHLVTIPLGTNNITQDLMTLQLEESEAEDIKIKYGVVRVEGQENIDETDNKTYISSDGRTIEISNIQTIIEARVNEIIANVRNQINNSNYDDKLLAGMVITGGGANMKDIDKAFAKSVNVDKVRIAKGVNQPIIKNSTITNLVVDDSMHNTILSLLLSGEVSCGGDSFDGTNDIFKQQQDEEKKKQMMKENEADAAMSAKLDAVKMKIRENIMKVKAAKVTLEKEGKEKKVRREIGDLLDVALDVLDADYNNCISVLEVKDKYKLSVNEAKDIADTLKTNVNELAELLEVTKKRNNWMNKVMNALGDLVTDD